MSKIYKALMVEEEVHYKIVVEAKKRKITISNFVRELYGQRNNKKRLGC